MSELKPCPNCRAKQEHGDVWLLDNGNGPVFCRNCEMRGPRKNAIDAWNAIPRAPQWTTYDGTQETLPKERSYILLMETQEGFRACGEHVSGGLYMDGVAEDYFEIGDCWMYWPKGDDDDA